MTKKKSSRMAKEKKFAILLDENVPSSIATWLQTIKPEWKVSHTNEVRLKGKSDEKIFEWAQENKAAILTFDDDFADRRSFSVKKHYGIIRLRVWPTTVEKIQDALNRLCKNVDNAEIVGSLIIIDNHKLRIRSYP